MTAINEVGIINFWDAFFAPVIATVQNDTLTIARQEPDGDAFFVEGRGVYTKDANGVVRILFNYVVSDESSVPIQTDVCTNTVFTKL
jgi:hypothetical protein